MTMKMTPMIEGQQGNTSIKVEGSLVEVNLTAKPDATGERYQMKWTFDFEGVSPMMIMTIAANYLKIRCQDKWRKEPDLRSMDYAEKTWNVLEILDNTRSTASKGDKLRKTVSKMTAEERAVLLAELQSLCDV